MSFVHASRTSPRDPSGGSGQARTVAPSGRLEAPTRARDLPDRTVAGWIGDRALLDLQRLAGNAAVGRLVRSVQRIPDEMVTGPATQQLGTQLEQGEEEAAIGTFGTLDDGEATTVLRSARWRDLATSAFGNATMHRAMMATGPRGPLRDKLAWEFDEGTDWEQVQPLIAQSPRPQRRDVITEPSFRGEFTSICGNETMGVAVRLLGPPLVNQLDWMIDEGVDETQFVRLIEDTAPADMYAAARDTGLMSRLRDEVGTGSRVVATLESAAQVAPTGDTPVGPRWTADDARMLAAGTSALGVISAQMASRVPGAVSALSEADYTEFRTTLDAAGSGTERAFICKALAAGRTMTEVAEFALLIRGMTDAWLLQNLNVVSVSSPTDTGGGSGIIQQFGNSCGPTSMQVVVAEADPVYALALNSAGPITTAPQEAVSHPETITNAMAAGEQSDILTAHHAKGAGNAPTNRTNPTGGAWVEKDMNARKRATGVEYTRQNVPEDVPIDEALAIITVNVGMGIAVPIIVGASPGAYTHYVVVVRKDGDRYQIHNVGNGETLWRTGRDFRVGSLNIGTLVWMTAFAEPHRV